MTQATPASPAFERFLTQLHATGREKLDGFDQSHFRGLTSDERADARRRLTAATFGGDVMAALGLAMLDGIEAVPSLRDALPVGYNAPTTARAMMLGALWRLTHDPAYADQLAALAGDLSGPPDSLRLSAVVRRTALVQLENSRVTPTVIQVLRRAIRDDPDQTVRSIAAGELLYNAGIISDVNQAVYPHMDLYRAIVEGDRDTRSTAADRFEGLLARA